MNPLYVGQTVSLKPARADAYGFQRAETYRVTRLFTRPGYKALWAELEGGSMVAPMNRVKANEIR